MSGAATSIGLPEPGLLSHLTAATASRIGTAIEWHASLAPVTIVSLYFPTKARCSA